MPPDPFYIALEHHRGGRLSAAEAGYRDALREQPDHADAQHWLGVLLAQAEQFDEAVKLLRAAAAGRPDDAAFQHNLGQVLLQTGRGGEAVAAFERADQLSPDRPETLDALARAYLARQSAGDADRAAAAVQRAIAAGGASAARQHDLGIALLAAGHVDDAIAALSAAAKLKPDFASASYHLALAYRAKGEPREVRRHLNRAIEAEPSHARAWYALGMLDLDAGNAAVAIPLFRKAIKARPQFVEAYEGLVAAMEKSGQSDVAAAKAARDSVRAMRDAAERKQSSAPPAASPAAAVADLEQRLTPAGEMAQLHEALAAMTRLPPPARPAPQAVAELFDRYAETFDGHLRQKLEYRGPELIAAAVQRFKPDRLVDVLDLGCGTGLCGERLRPFAASLAGVDLSPAILEKARERGVYDSLAVGDLVETLRSSPRRYDMLVAADVLVYLGDLSPTFEAAASALRPGGLFVFTVEASGGERFEMDRTSKRYRHSRPYLEHLARIHGFQIRQLEEATVRSDAGNGFVVVLQVA